jgi:hypothetical protein
MNNMRLDELSGETDGTRTGIRFAETHKAAGPPGAAEHILYGLVSEEAGG